MEFLNRSWMKGLYLHSSRKTGRTTRMIADMISAYFNLQLNEHMLLVGATEQNVKLLYIALYRHIVDISNGFEKDKIKHKIIFGTPKSLYEGRSLLGVRIKQENIFMDHFTLEDINIPYHNSNKANNFNNFMEKLKLCVIPKK
jgi:hypothetical protein